MIAAQHRTSLRKLLIPVVGVLAGVVALAACGGGGSSTPTSPSTTAPAANDDHRLLTATEAAALLSTPPPGLIVIDVRTPEEFAAGHIAGSNNVDFNSGAFTATLPSMNPQIPYFIYCHTGRRSAAAAAAMQQAGIASIYELQGGISTWEGAGLPVVTT